MGLLISASYIFLAKILFDRIGEGLKNGFLGIFVGKIISDMQTWIN
jgi:hypothetical protein